MGISTVQGVWRCEFARIITKWPVYCTYIRSLYQRHDSLNEQSCYCIWNVIFIGVYTCYVMGARTIQNVYPVYQQYSCKATKFLSRRRVQFKCYSVWFTRSVFCHHLSLLTRVVRQHRTQHLIVCLGGNDLDVADWDWSAEFVVAKLVTLLTQLRNIFLFKTVTILSYIPKTRDKIHFSGSLQIESYWSNCLLQDFWKLLAIILEVERIPW